MPGRPSRRILETGLFLLILAATAALYLPTVGSHLERETVDSYVYPAIFHLVRDFPAWMFYQATPGFIRPTFILSLFPEMWISGFAPWSYHLTNLLIHLACVAALYAFGRIVFGRTPWLLLAAGIFALHPAIAGVLVVTFARQESLSLLFLLLGLSAWGLYLKAPSGRRYYPWVSGGFFFLALTSKEMAICFPLLLAALHVTLYRQRTTSLGWKQTRGAYLGFALFLAGYLGIRWLCLGSMGGYGEGVQVNSLLLKRFIQVVLVPVTPFGYKYLFTYPRPVSLYFYVILGFLVLLLGLRPRRGNGEHWATIFGFLFMIFSAAALLTLDWVVLGVYHIYMPLAGFALGVAGLFREAAGRFPGLRKSLAVVAGLIILAFLPAAQSQIQAYFGTRQALDAMLDKVLQDPPEPGRTLQVWYPQNDYMAIFDSYSGRAGVRHEKYMKRNLDLIVCSPARGGRIVVGFHLWRPYEASLNLGQEIYQFSQEDGSGRLTRIDSTTFVADAATHAHMGAMRGAEALKKKNPALISLPGDSVEVER